MSSNSTDEEFKRLLWFLLGGSRGGENRIKILHAIRSRPSNLNQLAKIIRVDYRSVQHHIAVLQKNNLVLSAGEGYGVVYSIHPYLEYHIKTFEQVCAELGCSTIAPDFIKPGIETSYEVRQKGTAMPQTGRASDGLHL